MVDDETRRPGPVVAARRPVPGRLLRHERGAGQGLPVHLAGIHRRRVRREHTLSVQGPFLGFTSTIERAVVGGTGKFRLACGYMLFKMISKPTPETDVNLCSCTLALSAESVSHSTVFFFQK